MKRKITVLTLVFLLILAMTASAMASVIDANTEIQPTGLNVLNVRLAVNNYFEDRLSFLSGNADTIPSSVSAMAVDEASHKAELLEAGFVVTSSTVTINSIECWDNAADVMATEVLTLASVEETVEYSISHDITAFLKDDYSLNVARDGYSYNYFTSASYVPDYIQNSINAGADGSSLCILEAANAEVGTTEGSDGSTEYGIWYGDVYGEPYFDTADWCAMFVAWCADQVNVSTSVIPCVASVPTMRNHFLSYSRYYSLATSSFTPQPGDLFFQYDSAESPNHIGIVHSVSGGYVYVIDGNYSNKVNFRSMRLTDTSIVAYARPNYASTVHLSGTSYLWNTSQHWRTCQNCNKKIGVVSHTLITDPVTGETGCKICSYGWILQIETIKPIVDTSAVITACCDHENDHLTEID